MCRKCDGKFNGIGKCYLKEGNYIACSTHISDLDKIVLKEISLYVQENIAQKQ